MKTILFLDDWPIQESRGLDRQWCRAEPWPDYEPTYDASLQFSHDGVCIERDVDDRPWRMWAGGATRRDKNLDASRIGVFLYESDDGINWRGFHNASSPPGNPPHMVFTGEVSASGACVFRDDLASNPEERYKMVYCDPVPDPPDPKDRSQCRIATSPDGVRWAAHPDRIWNPNHVDTFFSTTRNPHTDLYQWTARPISGDRRVSLYQTRDWKTFETPQLILHPDPLDTPTVEFYGLPHVWYEGYCIGFLWKMHGAYTDCGPAHRVLGKLDSELVYSVNGTHWNRTTRQSILPPRDSGPGGFGMEFPTALVVDDEGWMRVYGLWDPWEHDDVSRFDPNEPVSFLTISRLRRDGFCRLETHSDSGHLTLRPLISRGGSISLNAVVGRFGYIRAELRSVPFNKPIPGFELENSVPVEGDGHTLSLQWKNRATIDQFDGMPFRIHLEMRQAAVYAIRLNADYIFEGYIHHDLAGNYDPVYHNPHEVCESNYI